MHKFTKIATILTASCISIFALSTPAQAATPTKVSSVHVSKNHTTVYPAKDGYKDSVKFKVAAKTSGGAKVHGSATLKVGSKVVKIWKISKKTQSLTWNGRYKSAIVPGTYTLTVREAGTKGVAHTAKASVRVSAKKLVQQNYTTTLTADELFSDPYSDYSENQDAACYTEVNGGVLCVSTDSYYNDDAAVGILIGGKVSVPQQVQDAAKWGPMHLTVAQTGDLQTGEQSMLIGGNSANSDEFDLQPVLSDGSAYGTVRYAVAPSQIAVVVLFGEYSTLSMDTYNVTFGYTVLQ